MIPFGPGVRRSRTCDVCGHDVSYLDFLAQEKNDYMVCRSFECKRVMEQKAVLAPVQFTAHLRLQRKLIRERTGRIAAEKRRIEDLRFRESQQNQRLFQSLLAKSPRLRDRKPHMVAIPSGCATVVPLSEERIASYRGHLQTLIGKAQKYSEAAQGLLDEHRAVVEILVQTEQRFDANRELRDVSEALCGLCKGWCCSHGGDAAYLSALTIRQFMDANPAMSGEAVLDAYLSKLSCESIAGACINQTATGCALPREMRSATCKGHYCDSLKQYQERAAQDDVTGQALAIQRANSERCAYDPNQENQIINVALIDQGAIRSIPDWRSLSAAVKTAIPDGPD